MLTPSMNPKSYSTYAWILVRFSASTSPFEGLVRLTESEWSGTGLHSAVLFIQLVGALKGRCVDEHDRTGRVPHGRACQEPGSNTPPVIGVLATQHQEVCLARKPTEFGG